MSVQVYGCNHVAIEVDDLAKAQAFYEDVFDLKLKSRGESNAFFQLGNHQFLAMTEVDQVRDKGGWHFGLIVRDERQLVKVRDKVTQKYGLQLISGFRCAFRDPFDNRIDVVDLHDESLVWLLPYQEVQVFKRSLNRFQISGMWLQTNFEIVEDRLLVGFERGDFLELHGAHRDLFATDHRQALDHVKHCPLSIFVGAIGGE